MLAIDQTLVLGLVLLISPLGTVSARSGIAFSRKARVDIDNLIHNYSTRKLNSSPISKFRHVLSTRHTNRKVSRHQHNGSKDGSLIRSILGPKELAGTRIMRHLPSPQHLHRVMFSGYNPRNEGQGIKFNNEDVGMTKPSLDTIQYTSRIDKDQDSSSAPRSSLWWPQSALPSFRGWRVKTYRRRVGRGEECYNLVRNAALDWEFTDDTGNDDSSDGPTTGIVRAIPSMSSPGACSGIPENTSSNVLQIWSPDSNDISPILDGMRMRKLGTFTKMNILSGLQKRLQGLPFALSTHIPSMSLYVVNPTAVIYDIVDERAPSLVGRGRGQKGVGSTFTSTAYATLKGHLLCGEERVTVILRDEIESDAEKDNVSYSTTKETADRCRATPKVISFLDDSSRSFSTVNRGGFVDVEIVSYSKAAPSIFGRMVWPFIGGKQDHFFQCEMDSLERVAKAAEDPRQSQIRKQAVTGD